MHIDAGTRLCAVIGNPIVHSRSPLIHNAAYAACGLDFVYTAFAVTDVEGALRGMRAFEGFRGMSVTIPHKTAVMPFLDEIDPLAARIGCVNTITNENGRLRGTNTDGGGVVRSFQEAGVPLAGKRVLFLGAGGAIRAAAFAIADEAPAAMTVLGRTPENVAALTHDLRAAGAEVAAGALDADLQEALRAHDLLIQGTPAGMYPDREHESLVPAESLEARHVVFDMVYNPMKTRLIREAETAGCTVILGLEMLVNQAGLQFEAWTGVPAPLEVMRAALIDDLGARTG